MTAYQAVCNAVKALPPGRVRNDLIRVRRMLNWWRAGETSRGDAGATIIRFDKQDPRRTRPHKNT